MDKGSASCVKTLAIAVRLVGMDCTGSGSVIMSSKLLGVTRATPPPGLLRVTLSVLPPLCGLFRSGMLMVWAVTLGPNVSVEIGRASCRERVQHWGGGVA